MYFEESSKLIKDNILDKDLIRSLDRELARSFVPGGTGYADQSLLVHHTNSSFIDVERLMRLYEAVGVVSSFNMVICPKGHLYRPDDGQYPDCGRDASEGTPSDEESYSILKQPLMPVF